MQTDRPPRPRTRRPPRAGVACRADVSRTVLARVLNDARSGSIAPESRLRLRGATAGIPAVGRAHRPDAFPPDLPPDRDAIPRGAARSVVEDPMDGARAQGGTRVPGAIAPAGSDAFPVARIVAPSFPRAARFPGRPWGPAPGRRLDRLGGYDGDPPRPDLLPREGIVREPA